MAKAKVIPLPVEDDLQASIIAHGLGGLVQFAAFFNTQLVTHSTGFPNLDVVLNPENPGLATGIDVEVFSDMGSAGKTTLALQILQAWQAIGLRTMFVDIENAPGLEAYMNLLGILTRQEQCPPGIYAVRIMRGQKDARTGKVVPLTLQQVFNTVEICCKEIFDLIVVDSVDALVDKAEMEKTADDAAQWGGISKRMSEFMRKNTVKRATNIWLNQTREGSGFSPSGGSPKKTSGGRAMLYYADIRLKLDFISKLTEKKGDESGEPWGFVTKVTGVKNKTSSRARWKFCDLKCLLGEGFSQVYDYFDAGLTQGIIVKPPKSAWYEFARVGLKIQGAKAMYEAIRDNQLGSLDKLKELLDGEDVSLEPEDALPTPPTPDQPILAEEQK